VNDAFDSRGIKVVGPAYRDDHPVSAPSILSLLPHLNL